MITLRQYYSRGFAALLMSLSSAVAVAATSTTTFEVSATVADACSVAATNLAFGEVTPVNNANIDATSTVTVTCSLGTAYNITLDAGANAGTAGDVTTRRMKDAGTNYLSYQMYSDTLRSTVWGNTVGTNSVAGTGTGLGVPAVVYGRIPSGQQETATGSYTDTINVTVTY